MKIIFAGPSARRVSAAIPDQVPTFVEDRLESLDEGVLSSHDLLISFGYRHLISQRSLDILNGRAVNVHISMLPWNRGADPNFWSWATNTPKGVTVHWIDAGLDTGPIVKQRVVDLSPDSTLRETHSDLLQAGALLAADAWPSVLEGSSRAQDPGGTFHKKADLEEHCFALRDGWDTQCRTIMDYGRERGLWINSP